MATAERRIVIIAGPNGAGKTTFAEEILPRDLKCPTFVNADLIAAGLAPFSPASAAVRAGRLMLKEIAHHVEAGESFAFETTLAGRGYARRIGRWREIGYRVELIFLKLDRVETAIARVEERVRQGGHDVSEAIIRRRFGSGWRNFHTLYAPLVNAWAVYDNSDAEPVLIDWSSDNE